MANEEMIQLYDDLLSELKKHNGNWIVEQVEAQIMEGKSIFTKKPTYVEKQDQQMPLLPHDTLGKFRKSRKSAFTVIEEYSPKEKVLIFLKALERAICDTHDMATSIKEFLADRNITVRFYDENDEAVFQIEELSEVEISNNVRNIIEKCISRIN